MVNSTDEGGYSCTSDIMGIRSTSAPVDFKFCGK